MKPTLFRTALLLLVLAGSAFALTACGGTGGDGDGGGDAGESRFDAARFDQDTWAD